MKKATITEAKKNLSALIDGLKGGSSVCLRRSPMMRAGISDDAPR